MYGNHSSATITIEVTLEEEVDDTNVNIIDNPPAPYYFMLEALMETGFEIPPSGPTTPTIYVDEGSTKTITLLAADIDTSTLILTGYGVDGDIPGEVYFSQNYSPVYNSPGNCLVFNNNENILFGDAT